MSGEGTMTWPNNKGTFTGEWKNGVFNGYGRWEDPTHVYEGNWDTGLVQSSTSYLSDAEAWLWLEYPKLG